MGVPSRNLGCSELALPCSWPTCVAHVHVTGLLAARPVRRVATWSFGCRASTSRPGHQPTSGTSRFFPACASLELRCAPLQTGGLGTYEYMAPEVLGHQRYSEKVSRNSAAVLTMSARTSDCAGIGNSYGVISWHDEQAAANGCVAFQAGCCGRHACLQCSPLCTALSTFWIYVHGRPCWH